VKDHIILRKAKEMGGYAVTATDVEIGRVKDFYTDDGHDP
jgi:hypothetical protein